MYVSILSPRSAVRLDVVRLEDGVQEYEHEQINSSERGVTRRTELRSSTAGPDANDARRGGVAGSNDRTLDQPAPGRHS